MSVFTRAKNGLFGQTKPRNPHSLENLKYLYGVLNRNQTVSDANRDLLIETLRCISEILIWGDQNDSSVFDVFLERGMLTYFLHYMRQKNGRFICVQILQTLNILFENIRHETSLYYLLSNNHVNNIIVHKFDFTDEEVTAYYISFLKTLSLKLNTHSINFFYNERNNEFPLYVEAIKFFNHPETMVRIAVRTLTLNIYKVSDPAMHRFILDRTATEYFSNLVWFIRNHILEFDNLIRNNRDINNRGRITFSLEENLDHIHYLQDIFLLDVDSLNNVLKDQLMNRLLIPVYVFSLIKRDKFSRVKDPRTMLDQSSALFLLAEVSDRIIDKLLFIFLFFYLFLVFLVFRYRPVIEELADIILSANIETVEAVQRRYGEQITYSLPPTSLDICLAKVESVHTKINSEVSLNALDINDNTSRHRQESEHIRARSASSSPRTSTVNLRTSESIVKPISLYVSNWTDDEKFKRSKDRTRFNDSQLAERPYFEALIKALDCTDSDQQCFYALSVLLTMTTNPSVDSVILESVCLTVKSSDKSFYNTILIDQLCDILLSSTSRDSNIRLVTLSLAISLFKKLVYNEEEKISYLSDHHLARIEQAYEQSTEDLRQHYKVQEMFLDMFEDEYRQIQLNPVRLEYLLKDACMLYAPTTTPLSGVEFIKRLPSGDIERARRSIRVFFLIRALCLELRLTPDVELPLTKPENLVKENDKLDLNNSDLIACTVHMKEKKDRRFLVTDPMQFILIEPDVKRLGWGIVKFCDLMQDVEVANDKEDTRSLHITIHKPVSNAYVKSNPPILNAKFTFDDHIRCMTAKQNLSRGRQRARQIKLSKITAILDIPVTTTAATNQSNHLTAATTTYSQHQFGFSTPALPNHPGRAALVSGPKRQSISHNIPTSNRSITSSTTTFSTPSFSNIEHIRRYSLSRTHSEQPSNSGSGTSTPSTSRRPSTPDINERPRRDSVKSNPNIIAPKSLREWHEQPVNLSEQPPLTEKVNVQILSPNSDRTTARFFVDNDLASLVIPNGESKSEEILTTRGETINNPSNENENE